MAMALDRQEKSITEYDIICVNAQSVLTPEAKKNSNNGQNTLSRLEQLKNLCKRFNVSILCCTEARIDDSERQYSFEIDGYQAIVCYSFSRHTGGVVMYIKDGLNIKVSPYISTPYIWCLAIEITNSDVDGVYGGIYRNKDTKLSIVSEGLKMLDDFLSDNLRTNSQIEKKRHIFMGDINIDFKDSSRHRNLARRADDIFRKHNLEHVLDVDIPTRIEGRSATHIDVVVSNCEESDVICEIVKDEKISDHETIGIRLKRRTSVTVNNQVEFYSRFELVKLTEFLLEHSEHFLVIFRDSQQKSPEQVQIIRKQYNQRVEHYRVRLRRHHFCAHSIRQ